LLATPAIETLRQHLKNTKIDLLVHRNRLNLFENTPNIEVLGSISDKRSWYKGWLSIKKYDYVIVFNYGNDQTNIVRFALRVGKKVIASSTMSQKLNAQLFQCIPRKENHHVLNYMEYLAPLNIKKLFPRIKFYPNDREKEFALSLFKQHKILRNTYIVGFQLVSFPSRSYKDWPIDHFVSLAKKIFAVKKNAFFIIFGGVDDSEKAAQFTHKFSKGNYLDLSGLSLRKTAAVMDKIDLYVGVDTGPTHMMSAFDVPMLTMYHGKFPSKHYAPMCHPYSVAMDHPKKDKCSENDSMADISVDNVFSKLVKFLKK
jgi:heptosyltransferase-3